jgi:hypothetical protein
MLLARRGRRSLTRRNPVNEVKTWRREYSRTPWTFATRKDSDPEYLVTECFGDGETTVTEKMTVYRLGGWETKSFEQFEGELVVTIAYADTKEEPKTQEELNKTLRFLNVRMSYQQASEFGSQIWRRAEEQLRQVPPH